jgi:hypothetical protein
MLKYNRLRICSKFYQHRCNNQKRERKQKKNTEYGSYDVVLLKENWEEENHQNEHKHQQTRPPEHQIHQDRYVDVDYYRRAIKKIQIMYIYLLNIIHTRLDRWSYGHRLRDE